MPTLPNSTAGRDTAALIHPCINLDQSRLRALAAHPLVGEARGAGLIVQQRQAAE